MIGFRVHPKNDEKAPSTWFEFGLFSGPDDRGHPYAFQIDKTESEEDGSFRAYVRLTERSTRKTVALESCTHRNT